MGAFEKWLRKNTDMIKDGDEYTVAWMRKAWNARGQADIDLAGDQMDWYDDRPRDMCHKDFEMMIRKLDA